jgi:peroxin-12
MLKPALRHLFSALVIHWNQPDCSGYFEALYLLLSSFLDGCYLLSSSLPTSSTFVESMYGLSRASVSRNSVYESVATVNASEDVTELSYFQRMLSFVYVLLMPQLASFIQSLKEQLSIMEGNDSFRSSTFSKVKYYLMKFLSRVLQYGLTTESIVNVIFKILFLLKKIPFHSPLFYLLNMKLVKSKLFLGKKNKTGASPSNRVETGLPKINDTITSSPSSTVIPASSSKNWQMSVILAIIITVRAMEWYINNDLSSDYLSSKISKNPLSIPPYPPAIPVNPRGGIIPPKDKKLCPICCQTRKDPCAANSGYIFCYNCIVRYIQDHKQCPVTLLPCREEHLIKLYEKEL